MKTAAHPQPPSVGKSAPPRGKPWFLLAGALLILAVLWLSGCAADSGWGSSFKMAP
jgi:hypothetical protein